MSVRCNYKSSFINSMGKTKTSHAYELELKRMIKARTGEECDPWLLPQLRATAMNMVMLDKIQDEITECKTLIFTLPGSQGQEKKDAHPLLAHYDKLQRTLLQQFEALGLNYRSTPSKIKENVKKGGEEHNKLDRLLKEITEA